MRILHTNMLHGWAGQSNRILVEAHGAHNAGHKVAIAAPINAKLLDRADALGIETWRGYSMKPPAQFWKFIPDLLRFRRQVRAWKPDLIHVHGSQDTWLVAVDKALSSKPYWPLIRSKHHLYPWRESALNKWLYRRMDAYIAISRVILEEHLKAYPGLQGKPMEWITSVPDLEKYGERVPTTLREEMFGDEAPGLFIWGINARLRPEKGHDDLFPAFRQVLDKRPDARLLVTGTGSERARLEKLAESLGLSGAVRFLGFRENVMVVLSALDAFVHPSRSEGLGTSILEALAMGLPVVATRTGGILESVLHEKTGLMSDVSDVDGIAANMLRIMGDEELRKRLGEGARAHMRENFTEEALVRRTLAFYERIVAEFPPRRAF